MRSRGGRVHMSRIVHPPLTALHNLRQPLTKGERAVLELFHRKLSERWEIYIQPHMNGLRPDFILLNPDVGIGIFEVKDWNFNAMSYHSNIDTLDDRSGQRPVLRATHDGKTFEVKANPVNQVRRYKEEIFSLYCPRLQKKNGFAVITAGLIFPCARRDEAARLMAPYQTAEEREQYPQYSPIAGCEAIESDDLAAIFPEAVSRSRSKFMSPEHADDLRGWLVEPDFSATQRVPLELDARQKSYAQSRTESGYRRIKGSAGSGKSVVLAARAAQLAAEGKSVLVVTFNITLWHYLRDLVARASNGPGWNDGITFVHFHRWCRMVCDEVGLDGAYDNLWKSGRSLDTILNQDMPDLAIRATRDPAATHYDAILVDEGQDYRLSWWNSLRGAARLNAELLLVADATQDVYGTASAWTDDAMRGAGFTGRWAELETSYRMPNDAMELARTFAEKFLPKDLIDLPQPEQGSLALHPCALRWVQVAPDLPNTDVCVEEIMAMMKQTGSEGLANADITLLTDDQEKGAEIVNALRKHRIMTVSTFDENRQESRRKKMGFWMGDARVKATTLHSFKGWEARLLVVHITRAFSPDAMALVYAGLTRLKRSVQGSRLTVVCAAPELAEFGEAWPDHTDQHAPASEMHATASPLPR
jgi:hypothetical protein